jgi:hypothetical protein
MPSTATITTLPINGRPITQSVIDFELLGMMMGGAAQAVQWGIQEYKSGEGLQNHTKEFFGKMLATIYDLRLRSLGQIDFDSTAMRCGRQYLKQSVIPVDPEAVDFLLGAVLERLHHVVQSEAN